MISPHRNPMAIGMPSHSTYASILKLAEEFGLNLLWRSSIQSHDVGLFPLPGDLQREIEEQNPGAVRRPSRVISERTYLTFSASESWDNEQAASVALRPKYYIQA